MESIIGSSREKLLAVLFTFDKFQSYLIGSKVIVYMDHSAIKYLLTKKDVKPCLIDGCYYYKSLTLRFERRRVWRMWWQTTYQKIEQLKLDNVPINENFSDEHLLAISFTTSWYADYVNYLVSGIIPSDLSYHQRKK